MYIYITKAENDALLDSGWSLISTRDKTVRRLTWIVHVAYVQIWNKRALKTCRLSSVVQLTEVSIFVKVYTLTQIVNFAFLIAFEQVLLEEWFVTVFHKWDPFYGSRAFIALQDPLQALTIDKEVEHQDGRKYLENCGRCWTLHPMRSPMPMWSPHRQQLVAC